MKQRLVSAFHQDRYLFSGRAADLIGIRSNNAESNPNKDLKINLTKYIFTKSVQYRCCRDAIKVMGDGEKFS